MLYKPASHSIPTFKSSGFRYFPQFQFPPLIVLNIIDLSLSPLLSPPSGSLKQTEKKKRVKHKENGGEGARRFIGSQQVPGEAAHFVANFLFLYITILTVMGANRSDSKCSSVSIEGIARAFGGMTFALVYCTAGI